jgi:hypothetical protein
VSDNTTRGYACALSLTFLFMSVSNSTVLQDHKSGACCTLNANDALHRLQHEYLVSSLKVSAR